jgi:cytochrome c-type biogenesis protein CcmH
MKRFLPIILFLLIFTGSRIDIATAQGSTPTDDEVNAIAKQLYCPVCENTPLDVCPTQACAQWRALIREKLTDGWTEDQIKQYFVDNYGARVLSEPPPTGLNWMVYILPPLIILVGVFILIRSLKIWRHPTKESHGKEGAPLQETLSEEHIIRLEEELRNRG